MSRNEDVREMVRGAYGEAARRESSCCAPKASCCADKSVAFDQPVPEAEMGLSCGDPVAFAEVRPGDVVVDLGSGAGRDVFIAAKIAGAGGRVIGVDMTPEMLERARRNAEKFAAIAGLRNVEFREGIIERLPIADASVDLVVSNCVINLSPDKGQVFREVFRVLKPGGRMVVSDIVLERPLPESLRSSEGLYTACIAGALLRADYLAAVRAAGFSAVEVLADRRYAAVNAEGDPITKQTTHGLEAVASSITIRAVKASGCGCA